MNLVSKFYTTVSQIAKLRAGAVFLTAAFVFPVFALAANIRSDLPVGVQELLKYEQKYVNRTLDEEKILGLTNYQAKKYSPEKGQVFEIKSYWLDEKSVLSFESLEDSRELGISFKRGVSGQRQVLFLVHPESQRFYQHLTSLAESGPEFLATATASSRTLIAWSKENPSKPFFAKLSLDKEIGGVVRTIPAGEVARSIGVNQILSQSKAILPKSFGYLPEVFGAIPKGLERGGMILRAIPEHYQSGEVQLLPLFSLYTSPRAGVEAPIESMIELSGMPADKFIREKIINPFAELWVDLAVNHAMTVEAHAQNVLIEVGSSGLPTGKYVFRDFGGFNVNLESRRTRGLPMPKNLPVIESESLAYHQASHDSALVQSLETYFEGGFLFGLGEKLTERGHKDLSYQDLTKILREGISTEIQRKGFRPGAGHDYSLLATAINVLRIKGPQRPQQCEAVLRY